MVSKETEKKLAQLQLIEENLSHVATKKQAMQTEEFEIKNALDELKKAKGDVYRIVGQIMIKSDVEDITKELNSSKDMVELKLKSIEKQELSLQEKFKTVQAEVMGLLNKEEEKK